MAEHKNPSRPPLTDKARQDAEAKRERLAQALRDNLRRRKTQARARSGEGKDDESGND